MAQEIEAIRKKVGVRNDGLKYETQIIAMLAAQWANNNNVEDFWIATSLEKVDCFDDVIAVVTYKDKTEYLFMVQLKHSGKQMKLVLGNAKKEKDYYVIDLRKYKESYDKIENGNLNDVLKRKIANIPVKNKFWCIFTNMKNTSELTEKDISEDSPLKLLDICNRGVYSMWKRNISDCYTHFFNHLYFLTDQPKSENIPPLLQQVLPGGFTSTMVDAFINLVEKVNENKALTTGLFRQQCMDVQMSSNLELTGISVRIKERFFELWDRIFKNYTLIIVDENNISQIPSLLFSFYEYKIRKEYSPSFVWNECNDKNFLLSGSVAENLKKNKNLKVKHLSDLLLHMWNKNEIPFMLTVRQKKLLTDPVLGKAAIGKRFLLTSELQNIPICQDMKKFRNIGDLSYEFVKDIFAIEISLQGRSKVSIEKTVNSCRDTLNAVTTTHLLNLTSTKQEILSVGKSLPKPQSKYIQRKISEVHLDGDTVKRGISHAELGRDSGVFKQEISLSKKHFIQQLSPGLNVIANDAGMGKTTVLTSLIFQFDAADYLIYYNLADCLRNIKSKELNDSPIDYFFKETEGENYSQLTRSIYELQRAEQRVVLIIDSFDEISLHYKEIALKILNSLLHYKIRLLITTRTYEAITLKERYPDLKLFQLKELTDADIKIYLGKSKIIYTIVDKDFLRVPLHLSMISTINDDLIDKETAIVDLYEWFLERKIDVYCRDKMNMVEVHRNMFSDVIRKMHEQAALKFIFNENLKFEEVYQKRDICMSVGIISFVSTDIVQFQHHTYADYLAAKWICDNPEKSSKLCWRAITEVEYLQVCKFLIEIHNKTTNYSATLNKHELLIKDQWDLFPIHWAMAALCVMDYDPKMTMIKRIEKALMYMLRVEELCVLRSFHLSRLR